MCLSHVHMGSVFPLEPILLCFLIFSKPIGCLRDVTMEAHSVDLVAEYLDATTSSESEPRQQQQQQPASS